MLLGYLFSAFHSPVMVVWKTLIFGWYLFLHYFQVLTGDVLVSRCQGSRNNFEQSLGQIQTMVPAMLAAEVCQITWFLEFSFVLFFPFLFLHWMQQWIFFNEKLWNLWVHVCSNCLSFLVQHIIYFRSFMLIFTLNLFNAVFYGNAMLIMISVSIACSLFVTFFSWNGCP